MWELSNVALSKKMCEILMVECVLLSVQSWKKLIGKKRKDGGVGGVVENVGTALF